jgi:hypothetical protein
VRLTAARTSWGDVSVQGYSVDPGRSKVRAAWLSSPGDARRCAGGLPGTLTWQQGGSFGEWWSGPAPTDVHGFELAFLGAGEAGPLGHDSVVDVQLDAPATTCLRVPFAGAPPAPAWSWDGRWSAGMALRFAPVAPSIDGAHEVVSLALRAGRWAGPVRFAGEFGAGLHGCSPNCDGRSFQWLEAALGLEGFFARGDGWAASVEGAYTVLSGVGGPSTNQSLVHGPRLAVRMLRAEREHPGLPSGSRVRSHGLELYAAERLYAGDHVAGLVFGIGLVGDEGL